MKNYKEVVGIDVSKKTLDAYSHCCVQFKTFWRFTKYHFIKLWLSWKSSRHSICVLKIHMCCNLN